MVMLAALLQSHCNVHPLTRKWMISFSSYMILKQIISLVPLHVDSFILKRPWIPAMTDLFDPENFKLNYINLLSKCSEIHLTYLIVSWLWLSKIPEIRHFYSESRLDWSFAKSFCVSQKSCSTIHISSEIYLLPSVIQSDNQGHR